MKKTLNFNVECANLWLENRNIWIVDIGIKGSRQRRKKQSQWSRYFGFVVDLSSHHRSNAGFRPQTVRHVDTRHERWVPPWHCRCTRGRLLMNFGTDWKSNAVASFYEKNLVSIIRKVKLGMKWIGIIVELEVEICSCCFSTFFIMPKISYRFKPSVLCTC